MATMSSELKITVQLVATHNDASSSHTSIDLTTLFTLICLNMEKKLPILANGTLFSFFLLIFSILYELSILEF